MVSIGAKDVEVSSSQFEDFSVTTSGNTKPGELKVWFGVCGKVFLEKWSFLTYLYD